MLEILSNPWPWYITGPLIGLVIPLLLITGNKAFGISSSLRHICAMSIPSKVPYFNYDWKKEAWNLFFVGGLVVGGTVAATGLASPEPLEVHPSLLMDLQTYGITDTSRLAPVQLFNFQSLLTLRGFILIVAGGFLVGFGTRYAGGCTSGHSIMGISNFQLPSLIATICFMVGGIIMANYILPLILSL